MNCYRVGRVFRIGKRDTDIYDFSVFFPAVVEHRINFNERIFRRLIREFYRVFIGKVHCASVTVNAYSRITFTDRHSLFFLFRRKVSVVNVELIVKRFTANKLFNTCVSLKNIRFAIYRLFVRACAEYTGQNYSKRSYRKHRKCQNHF